MRYAAFGAKKYQSLVEHIPLDSFVEMPDVLGIGNRLKCPLFVLLRPTRETMPVRRFVVSVTC